jgi:histidinol-phosphate/aromatic aminotransferase/cobyric acid decarboxylase-like protein
MGGYGLRDCLRISVGSRADNERLLAAMPGSLEGAAQ